MTTQAPLTRDALKKAHYMTYRVDHCHYVLKIGSAEYYVEQADDMAALDVRLPAVFNQLTRAFRHTDDAFEAGAALAATLCYWDNPASVCVDDLFTSERRATYVTSRIERVFNYDAGLGQCGLGFIRYTLGNIGDLTFVHDVVLCDVQDVSCAWCEQHFPGSVARIKAAVALDLSPKEVAQFGFYTETMADEMLLASPLPASVTELLP